MSASGHEETHAPEQLNSLFDHLIGVCEQRIWNGYSQRPGSSKIDKQLDLCRLLDREFSRVCALKYFVHENRRTPTDCNLVRTVRHKGTCLQGLSGPNR